MMKWIFISLLSSTVFATTPNYSGQIIEFDSGAMRPSCEERGGETIRKLAFTDIKNLINQIKQRMSDPKKPSGYDLHLWQILERAQCIDRLLPKVKFNCENKGKLCKDGKASAWVSWIFGKIKLCDVYYTYTQKYQSAIMIHEVAHRCGAFDLEYHSKTKPRMWYNKIFTTYNNADVYSYWVRKGFCLPEHDC